MWFWITLILSSAAICHTGRKLWRPGEEVARGRSVLPLWRLIAGACGRCQTRPLLMLFIKTKSSGRFGSRSRLTTVHAAPARWRLARNFRGQQQTRSRAQASGSVLRSSARRWLFSSIWIRSPCLEVKEAELQTETAPSVRKVSLIAPGEQFCNGGRVEN